MIVDVLNHSGQHAGRTVELPEEIFGLEPNEHAIYLAVKQYLANQRQGTHKTKDKSEVSRSTRKIKKQKGTGGARAGSLKSPIFKGGGTIFGPKPRDYSFKLNKKLKIVAKNSALSQKAKQKEIVVLEDLVLDAPKTKKLIHVLANLGLANKRILLVLKDLDKNVYLSLRNIPKTDLLSVRDLNTYKILNNHTLILSESAVSAFNE